MKKWEYKKITGFENLNHWGHEGWEVVGTYYYSDWTFILKRELIENGTEQ